MKNNLSAVLALVSMFAVQWPLAATTSLEEDWQNPPNTARLRAYWWWLNGNITRKSITHDLEEMKAKGFGGALICDADGSSQDGNDRAPHGPTFFSDEWREIYKHALREADRLGLEISLNIQSGWNLGGPMVGPDDAPKKLTWSETRVKGGGTISVKLGDPPRRDNFYRDLFVLALPIRASSATLPTAPPLNPSARDTAAAEQKPRDGDKATPGLDKARPPLQNQREKALLAALRPFSAPDNAPLFKEFPGTPGEEDAQVKEVINLTEMLSPDGTLTWTAPSGEWLMIRFGYTLNDHCRVSTCSQGWEGYALDPFDDGAFRRYWDAVVEPLIADAGPMAGRTLRYLHTDSWEVEVANWTPRLREEFLKRRSYDLLPWLPVIAGKIVNSRDESNRFLHDFRRTMGDLAIDRHYRLFKERAHAHGLLIHPESGGPHAVPIDAQQCLGYSDAPMSEFWAWSWRHRVGDENRFFVKQPASAAHTYGRKLVLAEGFTTIGPHWQEKIWDNLKPAFDHALTEGLNLLVWHAFVNSPESEGIPGQQYFAGTHLNPNVTWWGKSAPFFAYINRCQAMLQQGSPVADVAFYYGDGVPNFARLRKSDPAKVGDGFDYDVVTEEIILNRMSVGDGRLVLPDGVSYRALVLVNRDVISLPVLRKLSKFASEGAILIGPKPVAATGLNGYPGSDAEARKLAQDLWSRGAIISDQTAREVLVAQGLRKDFDNGAIQLSYIHRRTEEAEIYFVANRQTNAVSADCQFRVSGKAPELWNAVTGKREFASAYEVKDGQTCLRIDFEPCGSWFVVFREPADQHPVSPDRPLPSFEPFMELNGSWQVSFDPAWGGPPMPAEFSSLVSWPDHSDQGIKFYSGTAVYEKHFQVDDVKVKAENKKWILDLGNVREIAEVKVNGKPCGILWCPPWRVDVTDVVKTGLNRLEVEIVNFWPNRIIGDAALPKERRLTRTNIRKLTEQTPLEPAGLLGPVILGRCAKPR